MIPCLQKLGLRSEFLELF